MSGRLTLIGGLGGLEGRVSK